MKKATTLVIVESPAKANKIQEYLGDKYIVKASRGHIADLAKGGKFGIGVDVDNNFKPRYVINDDKMELINELMTDAKNCEEILLSTDPDREGENIAWHLKTRLEDVGTPIKRMKFSEIKKSVLLKAVKDAGELDMNVVRASEGRRIIDRIVGFKTSSLLLNFFGPNLSSGRVQSVVTRMVIDREREIENFVPEQYWILQSNVKKDNINFSVKYGSSLKDKKQAEQKFNDLKSSSQMIVSSVIAKDENKYPNPPMITSTLQRIMSKDYGFGAERTMKAAQSLYESGYCTYIRTDSTRCGDEALESVREWIKENKYELPSKPHLYKNKDAAQDAHECIRPSDLSIHPDNNFAIIDPDEKTVYSVIWKYFIASQMMPAVYNTLKVSAQSKEHPSIEMKVSGKALKSNGYLDIFGSVDGGKIDLPPLQKGDVLEFVGKNATKLEEKKTQPPGRFSEDKLIEELEKRGIGRPATYATLLTKITDRNYVEKKGNVYHATELGKKITDELNKYFTFMNYDYTSKLENQLDEIERGKLTELDMLNSFYPLFKNELNKAHAGFGGDLCDKCGSAMVKKMTRDAKQAFMACTSYPSCKNTKNCVNK